MVDWLFFFSWWCLELFVDFSDFSSYFLLICWSFDLFRYLIFRFDSKEILDPWFRIDSCKNWFLQTYWSLKLVPWFNFREDLESSKKKVLILGAPTASAINISSYKILSSTEKSIEQYLSNQMVVEENYWSLKLLDTLMRSYLKSTFDLNVIDLAEKWSKRCYNCEKKSNNLKRCSFCKWAKYCSKECQRAYRHVDKVFDYERKRLNQRDSI